MGGWVNGLVHGWGVGGWGGFGGVGGGVARLEDRTGLQINACTFYPSVYGRFL